MLECLVCHDQIVERHHIKTRGSGGSDDESNIMILCRTHHVEFHSIGRNSFIKKYLLEKWMRNMGWYFDEQFKKWINSRIGA